VTSVVGTPPAATSAAAGRWWQLPRPTEPVETWHVSPLVDVVAYHFSWLWILVPLALMGETHPTDYLAWWAVGITTSFVHRHVTMPYVYLDSEVFRAFKPRLTLIPIVLLCGFIASIALQQARAPRQFFLALDVVALIAACAIVGVVWWRDRHGVVVADRALVAAGTPFVVAVVAGFALLPAHHIAFLAVVSAAVVVAAVIVGGRALVVVVVALLVAGWGAHALDAPALNASPMRTHVIVGAAAIVAALWNVWHTAAQKVGILRVYNAKSAAAVDKKVPLWVDRALVFGWFPLLAAILVDRERDTILQQGKVVAVYLQPIVDAVSAATPVLYPLGVACVLGSLGAFLFYEHRATGLRNPPRLSMAIGLTLLSASFLLVSPLKCYVAYGFSHAVEYVVFVWAFQRRRYAQPLEPVPLMQRVLKRGALFYGLFVGVIGAVYVGSEFGIALGLYGAPLRVFGLRSALVIYIWAIWHSFAHFYFDGFLWKVRTSTVRASL